MTHQPEKAILAGVLLESARSRPQTPGVSPQEQGPVARCRTRPIGTTVATPRPSRSSSTRRRSPTGICSSSSSRSTTRPPEPAGQRHRVELSLRHLLHQRPAEADRRGHDRRRRRLGSVAGQSGHRSRPRWPILGGRARAPGLPGTYPDGYTCHFVRPGWKLPHRSDKVDAVTEQAPPRLRLGPALIKRSPGSGSAACSA